MLHNTADEEGGETYGELYGWRGKHVKNIVDSGEQST